MTKEIKCNLYAIDENICPENDQPITDKQCSGCKFYIGFELYNGQRCIRCSAYHRGNDLDVKK